jgi:hypothetical protein
MKIILLTTLLLLLCNTGFTQYYTQPNATIFDKFINQPQVEWAAYANDTVRFDKYNLNHVLIERLKRKEIKASLPIESGLSETNRIKFLLIDSIDNTLLSPLHRYVAVYDSDGNAIPSKTKIEQYDLDTSALTLSAITQIIYIENGKLKTYVPWVSPTVIPVVTSSGISLGYGNYFSSCFNYQYNYQPAKQNKISFLSQTKKIIRLDTSAGPARLKELYGRNLAETLWPYVLANKFTLYKAADDRKIKVSELNSSLVDNKIPVPVYDANGNVSSVVYTEPFNPNSFTRMELVQDWYYDHTKNIVFNKINAAYLYAKKRMPEEQPKEGTPILKIVFN